MFSKLKEKNSKLANALETLVKALIGAILGFLSSYFIESCKTFDLSAEKLDIQVHAKEKDIIDDTFNQLIESNNSSN